MERIAELEIALYWFARTGVGERLVEVPEWVQVFILEQSPFEFRGGHASPSARARALQRYRCRALARPVEHCLRHAREALHPQLRIVWLLLLVHHHGARAIPQLLQAVAARDEFSEACAWALGRLGRDVVLEIGDRFGNAIPAVKELYCQALWYLGREARGCEAWLTSYDSPWSRAVLYRLEDYGWRTLLQWRASPIWLSSDSLAALAEMAFSLDEGERWYAVRALLGWGPVADQAGRILEILTYDADAELAGAALLALRHQGLSLSRPSLREILQRCPDEVCQTALKYFFEKMEPAEIQVDLKGLAEHPGGPLKKIALSCLEDFEPDLQLKALKLLELPAGTEQSVRQAVDPFLHAPHFCLLSSGHPRLQALSGFELWQ